MNKVAIKIIFLIIVISPLTLFYSIYLNSYLHQPIPNVAWVSWYDNPQNEVYIGWQTESESMGLVKYGKDPENLIEQKDESEPTCFHIVNLTGLDADSLYFYEIYMQTQLFQKGSFRTAPLGYSPFSFALTSDTQQKVGPGWHSRIAKQIGTKNYTFVGMVGDFVESGIQAEWNDYFKRAGNYLNSISLVPVRGNHDRPRDLNGDGSSEYYFGQYFPQSVDRTIGTNSYDNSQQFYYSFNWSSVHFQILHIPEIDLDDKDGPEGLNLRDYYQAFTSDHLAWIQQDLENAKDMPFRITMFHCPITSAGFYGPNRVLINELLPILHNYNVTATIHGHAHHYERGVLLNSIPENQDLTYFLVGTGGGLADLGLRPVPETRSLAASPCYTECYATENTLTFKTFSPDWVILDEITIYSQNI